MNALIVRLDGLAETGQQRDLMRQFHRISVLRALRRAGSALTILQAAARTGLGVYKVESALDSPVRRRPRTAGHDQACVVVSRDRWRGTLGGNRAASGQSGAGRGVRAWRYARPAEQRRGGARPRA